MLLMDSSLAGRIYYFHLKQCFILYMIVDDITPIHASFQAGSSVAPSVVRVFSYSRTLEYACTYMRKACVFGEFPI